jgi:hypothetical protein
MHEEAISFAETSAKLSHYILNDLIKICAISQEKVDKLKINHQRNRSYIEDAESNNVTMLDLCASKLLPIFHELQHTLVPDSHQANKHRAAGSYNPSKKVQLDMRCLLGSLSNSDWLMNLNIGNIMQLSPMTLYDLYSTTDKELELTRESVLDKISLIASSYFCISTEKRFISQLITETEQKAKIYKESEFWHIKSLEICCRYMPTDCPLMSHVYLSYQKHHSPIQHPIVHALPARRIRNKR